MTILIFLLLIFHTSNLEYNNKSLHKLYEFSTHQNKFFVIPKECEPDHPAIDDFPEDVFTNEQRLRGFVIVHVLVAIYFFILLAILCDFYFVPSLQQICVWLNLESDVAGATLMAIGSSAPTLFIAIISIFFTEGAGEIGLGTIVGSTIFNTLFIISACGFAVTHPIKLKVYPIIRDSLAYTFSILALTIAVNDKKVHWYEALIFVIIYIIYVIIMIFNKKIERLYYRIFPDISNYFIDDIIQSETISESSLTENSFISPFTIPHGKYEKFIWFVGWPFILIMGGIFPRIFQQKLPAIFELFRFLLSMFLLGFLSYVLVWMVCIIGFTFKIPDCVMGMTFLAAGSSIPDVMASIAVAKKDQAAMGISNAIGSNVFDMLCLGLPWLIKTLFFEGSEIIEINSNSLILSTSLLLGSMIYTVVCFYLNNFMIDKKIGYMFLVSYLSVIGISL